MWALVLIFLIILSIIFSFFLKKENMFWIVVILASVAIGVMADILRISYLPDEVLVGTGQLAVIFVLFSFIFFHVPVYAFLMLAFSLYRMPPILRKMVILTGLLPLVYDASHTSFIPSYEINYLFLFWLWLLYIISGSLLIVLKYIRTPPSFEKSHYLSIIIVYVPHPWLALFTFILPLSLHGVGGEWPYFRITLQLSVSLAFMLNLYYILFPGFFGVRLSSIRRKTKSRLVASGVEILNHSLKNEANKMLFIARELKMMELDQKERSQYIDLIEQSAKEMSATLEKLNTKTRKVTINLGVHTVEQLLDNVREKCAMLLHQRNMHFTISSAFAGTLHCDLQLLSDDLYSLIDNAIYATAKCEEPTIRIEVGTYGRYVYISLWDNGCGISKDNRRRLFEPYFTTKNKSSNFGVGLFACFNNISAQNGLIHIESEEGAWTKVNIYIRKGN
ncbi:sensor histidine kinase [Cohnella faecalis]|uniref:histidine kinase n=1 Tax=Cohnella faecalis TaxID=2315694 RepID=A0A398CSV0_9BACL|nr:HAMP domain-containing sensor histidine kinase [Cohnella faecalis]RIE02401.1 sensor histidine kinase [Cohnella faecalis]